MPSARGPNIYSRRRLLFLNISHLISAPRFRPRTKTPPRPSPLLLTTSTQALPLLSPPPPTEPAPERDSRAHDPVVATSPPAMVISAEPPPPPLPSDPTAEGGADAAEGGAAAEEALATMNTSSSARHGALSSFPSTTLKTWGSHRVLRCAAVNRAGDAIAPAASRRSSPQQLDEVREDLLLGLREVALGAPAAEEDESPEASPRPRPRRTRVRRRPAVAPAAAAASASPSQSQRRLVRADALDRPRFSATLNADEIEEDVYALTGARPRRRPRRRPRAVQKQLDRLLPGAWLSEITADSYRVPDEQ